MPSFAGRMARLWKNKWDELLLHPTLGNTICHKPFHRDSRLRNGCFHQLSMDGPNPATWCPVLGTYFKWCPVLGTGGCETSSYEE